MLFFSGDHRSRSIQGWALNRPSYFALNGQTLAPMEQGGGMGKTFLVGCQETLSIFSQWSHQTIHLNKNCPVGLYVHVAYFMYSI